MAFKRTQTTPLEAAVLEAALLVAAALGCALGWPQGMAAAAQTPAPAASTVPHQSGTIKSVQTQSFVLTTASGQEVAVAVSAGAPVLLVQPGSRDLKSAQPGTVADITAGDRVIVNGSAGDTGLAMHASRVIVMKSGAIEASQAADQAAWARGVGGIVRSLDPANGDIAISSGMRDITVVTTPQTVVRRYTGGSVRFADAVTSTVAAVHPGDQLRARGNRSADGRIITADEIVTGSFSNFSGVVSAVDPATGSVTLKDLASKKSVTVAVTSASDLRRLPAAAAQAIAGREAGGAAGGREQAASAPAGGSGEGGSRPGGAGRPGGGMGGDLSRMLNRLPTQTLAEIKPGDAVMIVASNSGSDGEPTAITLLAGVEPILAAHPAGGTTLSPWNLGGGVGEAEPGGEPR